MDFPLPKKIRLTSYAGTDLNGVVCTRYDGPAKVMATVHGSYVLQSGDYTGPNYVATYRFLAEHPTWYTVLER